MPSSEEQVQIVRFIAHVNHTANHLIRAKRRLIALLNEQKQAITWRVVTRGLDTDVPLKPSGLSWLGDVPEHWTIQRIKFLLREIDIRSETGSEPLLSMRMHRGLVLFSDFSTRPPQAATLVGFKRVEPGEIVLNRMQAGNSMVFESSLSGLVSPDYAVFRPIVDVSTAYLAHLFRTPVIRAKFRAESKGLGTGTAGFLRLYTDRFGSISIALPPIDEQYSILTALSVSTSSTDKALERSHREIDLIREYRDRLIADLVTGKLDVRGVRLPTDAYESKAELLDEFDESLEEGAEDVVEFEAEAFAVE